MSRGSGVKTNDAPQRKKVKKATKRTQRKDTPLTPSREVLRGEASLVPPERKVCAR